jgi:hypothetical protein
LVVLGPMVVSERDPDEEFKGSGQERTETEGAIGRP